MGLSYNRLTYREVVLVKVNQEALAMKLILRFCSLRELSPRKGVERRHRDHSVLPQITLSCIPRWWKMYSFQTCSIKNTESYLLAVANEKEKAMGRRPCYVCFIANCTFYASMPRLPLSISHLP